MRTRTRHRWPRAMPRCSPGWRSRGRRRAPGWPPCSGRRARPSRPATRCASACSSSGASSASSWSAATRPCRWPRASSTTSSTRGSVLGDAGDELGPELAAWLGQQRERRALRHRAALEGRADAAEHARDYDGALAHARELLALEPLSEAAHRRMIRVLYLQGDRAAALLAFDRCEQMLKDEVGTAPSAETLALLATISAAGVARVAGAGPGPAGERAAAAAADRPRRGVARAARGLGRRPQRRRHRRGRHGQEPAGRRLRAGPRPHPRRRRAARRRAGRLRLRGAAAARPARRLPARPRRPRCGAPSPGCCPSSASRRRCPAAKARRASSTRSAPRSRPRRWRSKASSSTTCTSPTPPASSCCSTRSALDAGAGSSPRAPARCRPPGRTLLDEAFAPDAGRARGARAADARATSPRSSIRSASTSLQGQAIAATLLRHCGGNPLYLLETLKAWLGGRGARAATAPCRRGCRSPARCTR